MTLGGVILTRQINLLTNLLGPATVAPAVGRPVWDLHRSFQGKTPPKTNIASQK